MLVQDILDRVRALYNDPDYVRVPKATYLQFLDDAINQLILLRPDAHVKTEVVKLQQGTRQSIPAAGYALIDIYMNKTPVDVPNGVFDNGAPVLQVERKDLDYFSSWHTIDKNPTEIEEFAYDMRTPRTFWVSPAIGANDVYVEMDYSYGSIEYAKQLDAMTFDEVCGLTLEVEDVFKAPLISYMLYLLYSTDSSSVIDKDIAQRYEQSFYQALGLEYQSSVVVMPKIELTNSGVVGDANG